MLKHVLPVIRSTSDNSHAGVFGLGLTARAAMYELGTGYRGMIARKVRCAQAYMRSVPLLSSPG